MNEVTVINKSKVYCLYGVLFRVARYMAGDEYYALHDEGKQVVKIHYDRNSNTYIVYDV